MKSTTVRKVSAKKEATRRAKAAASTKKAKKKVTTKVTKTVRKVHKLYLVQNGCHDCAKVFKMPEFDSEAEFFCHRDKSPRPTSGSIALDEGHTSFDFKSRKYPDGAPDPRKCDDGSLTKAYEDYIKQYKRWSSEQQKKWDAWADPRRVHACGFCPQYRSQEEKR